MNHMIPTKNRSRADLFREILGVFVLVLSFFYPHSAKAHEPNSGYRLPYIGIQVGTAWVDNSSFDPATTGNVVGGVYLYGNTGMELGYSQFEPFLHQNLSDTRVEIRSAALNLAHRFDFNSWFALRPGIGVHLWEAESFFLGNSTGDDRGISLMMTLSILFTLKERLFGTVNIKWLENVSGADIWSPSIGVGVNF